MSNAGSMPSGLYGTGTVEPCSLMCGQGKYEMERGGGGGTTNQLILQLAPSLSFFLHQLNQKVTHTTRLVTTAMSSFYLKYTY